MQKRLLEVGWERSRYVRCCRQSKNVLTHLKGRGRCPVATNTHTHTFEFLTLPFFLFSPSQVNHHHLLRLPVLRRTTHGKARRVHGGGGGARGSQSDENPPTWWEQKKTSKSFAPRRVGRGEGGRSVVVYYPVIHTILQVPPQLVLLGGIVLKNRMAERDEGSVKARLG